MGWNVSRCKEQTRAGRALTMVVLGTMCPRAPAAREPNSYFSRLGCDDLFTGARLPTPPVAQAGGRRGTASGPPRPPSEYVSRVACRGARWAVEFAVAQARRGGLGGKRKPDGEVCKRSGMRITRRVRCGSRPANSYNGTRYMVIVPSVTIHMFPWENLGLRRWGSAWTLGSIPPAAQWRVRPGIRSPASQASADPFELASWPEGG